MRYVASGGFWLLLAQGINLAAGLAMAVAFANLLPKETFGVYRFVLSVASILATATFPGLNTALIRAVASENTGAYSAVFLARIRWGVLGALAALGAAGYYWINDNVTLCLSFLILALFIPFSDPLNVYEAYRNGKKHFFYVASAEIVTRAIGVSAMILILFTTQNVPWLIFFYFLTYTSLRAIFYIHTRSDPATHKPLSQATKKETLDYGVHLSVIYIISAIAAQVDKIVVFHYAGATSLAAYAFAVVIPEQMRSAFKHLATLAYPRFVTGNLDDILKKTFRKNIFIGICALCSIIGYMLAAPLLFTLFFPAYTEAVYLTQILALTIVDVLTLLPLSALKAHGVTNILYKFNIAISFVQVTLITLGGMYLGVLGVIYALIVSRVIAVIYLHALVLKVRKSLQS
jgi:O-antigen/teichoic acid export membrane protein